MGRGPLAGGVVAAAVAVEKPLKIEGLRDSKELTHGGRLKLEPLILEQISSFSLSEIPSEEIDKMGISLASKLAMAKAVEGLNIKEKALVLVDGPWRIPIQLPQLPVRKGDRKIPVISAASILAKLERDRMMTMLDEVYPGYSFSKNKGYPTREHVEGIKRLGPSPVHRRSFKHCL